MLFSFASRPLPMSISSAGIAPACFRTWASCRWICLNPFGSNLGMRFGKCLSEKITSAGSPVPENEPERIVAGAGVQLREVPPHPQTNANGKIDIVSGRQAIIQNVFTEPEWRRRGLAALFIKRIIDRTRQEGIYSLVLHASDEGRALYERLGFIATTES